MDKHFFDELHHDVRNSVVNLKLYVKQLPTLALITAAEYELRTIETAMKECGRKCGIEE